MCAASGAVAAAPPPARGHSSRPLPSGAPSSASATRGAPTHPPRPTMTNNDWPVATGAPRVTLPYGTKV